MAPTKEKEAKKAPRRKKAAKAVPKHAALVKAAESEAEAFFEIEYVAAPAPSLSADLASFSEVFSNFETRAKDAWKTDEDLEKELQIQQQELQEKDKEKDFDELDLDFDKDLDAESKRKKKLEHRLSIAQLKQLVTKPDVVEWVDVTAADPKLLVHLKSYRNTVPVPIHWQQKRKYLQGKRGIEKPPFDLPDFIKQTGIMDLRQAVKEKEDSAKLKSKTRERTQPKMGKLDIDYQKLHDAFFRWQTKPKLSLHGDMYYEGKEYETKLKLKKPGQLSEELKDALGMSDSTIAPPWLVNMQRYGPPPSYPGLKVPGLNCPIPHGAQWGYHVGGWGKPPVDEFGRPLYGDVFGVAAAEVVDQRHVAQIERTLWGELEPEEEVEVEDDEEEEEQEEEEQEEAPPAPQSYPESGLVTPSGLASVPSGLETPDYIELRKDTRRDDGPKELYKIIPQKDTSVRGFMGSQHTYDLSSAGSQFAPPPPTSGTSSEINSRKRKAIPGLVTGDKPVAMSLNPEDLEDGLEGDAVKRAYEDKMKAARKEAAGEDFSDLVAEHANRQMAKKRKKDDGVKKGGKEEKFKF
ncbi:UNVERIFIED_CONTAM: Splicing factor 3B subunit 2 [Siphonaria sp. JEL0065]|nr:Splicing factor 3B subunit 2 [Siphonaria sp. JEL0065]